MSALVEKLLGHAAGAPGQDGFGQSMLDDLRFNARYRKCRRQAVTWRKPTGEEEKLVLADPFLGRFADEVCGFAEVEGRQWIALERLWHGWPDPPQYAFFAFEDGEVWAAADFDEWPGAWRRDEVSA